MKQAQPTLLAGGEVNLVGRVEATVRGLLAGAGVGGTATTRALRASGKSVLGRSALAGAFTGRTRAARAASAGLDGVFGSGLLAGAVESGLLAAAASSLASTSTFGIALAAAGGSFESSHCEGRCVRRMVSKV